MEIIFLLLPLSLLLSAGGLAAYLWSVNNGQFDDLDRSRFKHIDDGSAIDLSKEQNAE